MKSHTYVAAWLALFLFFVPATVRAQFNFVTNNGAITITEYTGTNGVNIVPNPSIVVVIPSSTNGLPVTSIGDWAFDDADITGVTIPNSVTNIGTGAFAYCFDLYLVTVPNSVTSLANDVFFDDTNLNYVTIPNGIGSIGVSAFEYCSAMTDANIPGSVTNLGDLAFQYCTSLQSVYFEGNAPVADSTVFEEDDTTVYYLPGTTGWGKGFGGVPALLWNPTIQTDNASFGVQSNGFGFTITGTPNIAIEVQGCTNLANPQWLTDQTCALTNGSVQFYDPYWTNSPNRFYRISSQTLIRPDPFTLPPPPPPPPPGGG